MFVDTSVFTALLLREPDGPDFEMVLLPAPNRS